MEKFGVEEPVENEKVAEARDTKRCPICQSPLKDPTETGVLVCPQCGTKPFEDA